jgi:bifunctional DNA-binding transcriptional regulator/antitoxin component of YhaV-PrlF toxin-antitoxin module
MSATPTVSAKGKLTLSEGVLKHLGVEPGDKVVIAKLPGGKINISAAPRGSITEAFGFLKRKGQSGPFDRANQGCNDTRLVGRNASRHTPSREEVGLPSRLSVFA